MHNALKHCNSNAIARLHNNCCMYDRPPQHSKHNFLPWGYVYIMANNLIQTRTRFTLSHIKMDYYTKREHPFNVCYVYNLSFFGAKWRNLRRYEKGGEYYSNGPLLYFICGKIFTYWIWILRIFIPCCREILAFNCNFNVMRVVHRRTPSRDKDNPSETCAPRVSLSLS